MALPNPGIDAFGVPHNVLNLSDEFYAAVGRVAALGAVLERRTANLISCWDPFGEPAPENMGKLQERFKQLRATRPVPERLIAAVQAAKAAMEKRNEVIHSLWPSEEYGWRQRTSGTEVSTLVGVPALRSVILRLVAAIDGLGNWLYTPSDV